MSLAFELNDSDFQKSIFASDHNDAFIQQGTGDKLAPLFTHTGGIIGPSWALLRDYYMIYRRMEDPLNDPVFNAQTLFPNRGDLSGRSGQRKNAPPILYCGGYHDIITIDQDQDGDPLRAGAALPMPSRASYLPYLQRHVTEAALSFQVAQNNPDKRWIIVETRPSYVFHNPYNVTIRHNGLAAIVDHIRFDVTIDSLPDIMRTQGNLSAVKVTPGTFAPGEVRVFAGDSAFKKNWWSSNGPQLTYQQPVGGLGPYLFRGGSNNKIEIDPGIHTIRYRPFNNERWPFWLSTYASGQTGESLNSAHSGKDLLEDSESVAMTSSPHGDIFNRFSDWYGGEDIKGTAFDTENHLVSTLGYLPQPFMIFDFFLKPAGYGNSPVSSSLRYPSFTHSNPLAPALISRNLLPTGKLNNTIGYPVYAPDWQLEITSRTTYGGTPIDNINGSNGFWGNSNKSNGSQNVSVIPLPTSPPLSIGHLQGANLSLLGHMPALAVGQSFASPYIPRSQLTAVFKNDKDKDRYLYDLSYLVNETLWDDYFFSSLSQPYNSSKKQYAGKVSDLYDAAFDINTPTVSKLPNSRMNLLAGEGENTVNIRNKLFSGDKIRSNAFSRSAENLVVKGAFNINSTSVNSWRAVLSGARDLQVPVLTNGSVSTVISNNSSPFSRLTLPAAGLFSGKTSSREGWQGFAALSDKQIETLATAIVDEIKDRAKQQVNNTGTSLPDGPFLSLASFVNRQLSNTNHGLVGLLQAAIEKAGINQDWQQNRFAINASDLSSGISSGSKSFPSPNNIEGTSSGAALSAPTCINQGDILQAIGSFIQTRSDTFTIRSYGEVVDPISKKVLSHAWCEAVVQRIPSALYPSNNEPFTPVGLNSGSDSTKLPHLHSRQFKIVSFRWLNKEDI